MDNPFINFNKTHTPTEEGLYMLLSKLPIRENKCENNFKENINAGSVYIKSPISPWSMPWAWAGGFSMMGAMAALVFMFTNTNNINTNIEVPGRGTTTVSTATVAKGNVNSGNIENKKVKNVAIVDEALATVSGLENMSADNKF